MYGVPRTTLRLRLAGRPSRRDCHSNSANLTKKEKEIIVKYIRKLAARECPPTLNTIREMANTVLTNRGRDMVNINWLSNFVHRIVAL
jgi:hypothetical protein